MSNGNGGGNGGGGIDIGGILGGLLGGLAAAIQAIFNFLNALVKALVSILTDILTFSVQSFGFSFKSLSEVFRGFKNLMDQIFKVWVAAALKHLWDLYQKLTAWVRKLKVWLDRLRKIQQSQLMQTLRRFLNLIQRVRRILVVFKLLHLGIAKKLDDWLARLEGRLTTSVLRQIQKTNEIIKWVNLIADPRGLLHPGGQLSGLGGILKGIQDALDGSRPGSFNCVPGQATGPGVPVLAWVSVRQQLITESKSNSGDTAAVGAQFDAMGQLFAADIGDAAKLRTGG